MDDRTKEVKEAYGRFRFHKDTFNGIYIYANYEKDLNTILDFVNEKLSELEDINE